MSHRFIVAAVTAGCLAAPATSHALVDVKVAPQTPIVDDDVTASFTVKKPLRSGLHYEALLLGRTGDCAHFVAKTSKRNPKKGKRMSFHFSPYDDELDGGPEFCQGKASVFISSARNSDSKGGKLIGIEALRFVAKP